LKHKLTRLLLRLIACAASLALIIAVDLGLQVNPTTAALTFLIAVLIVSAYGGLVFAVAMAVACTLAFNFFFLPPTGTFVIAEAHNWVALGAFLMTALVAGNLAERARREAAKAITAEAARQSERLRAALLDSVAHEFRTPLTAIKAGVTTLLSDGSSSGAVLDDIQRRDLLTVIDEEADRLDGLVGAASQMAQLESSAVSLEIEDVRVEEVVQNAVEAARPYLRQHEVAIEIADGLPRLRADRQRTAQALRHLLENAGKYSAPGTPVHVRAEAEPNAVRISVIDHGQGIAPGEEKLIFDKFFRGASQRHSVTGSGMGLAIAKVLVEAQAGQIGVNSTPGAGSVFYLRLPV
jgi:two-component system, OmpR family, sensor histidine kinase KdpD